jgi:hypothetical protein
MCEHSYDRHSGTSGIGGGFFFSRGGSPNLFAPSEPGIINKINLIKNESRKNKTKNRGAVLENRELICFSQKLPFTIIVIGITTHQPERLMS